MNIREYSELMHAAVDKACQRADQLQREQSANCHIVGQPVITVKTGMKTKGQQKLDSRLVTTYKVPAAFASISFRCCIWDSVDSEDIQVKI